MLFSRRYRWAQVASRWCDHRGCSPSPVNTITAIDRLTGLAHWIHSK